MSANTKKPFLGFHEERSTLGLPHAGVPLHLNPQSNKQHTNRRPSSDCTQHHCHCNT